MKYNKFTFFWNGPFSNWQNCKFVDTFGTEYNCSEQYMMAEKAKIFHDEIALSQIMKAGHPREQKAIGRTIKNFNSEVWNLVAKAKVYEGCKLKFEQNPELLKALFATQGTLLVEASPYDVIWGIGMKEGDPGIENPENWKGTNWLGEVLTKLRDDLLTPKTE